MQDVFELQAIFAFTVLALEVPSGYLADIWGRKRCLLIGAIFNGIGYSALLSAQGYWDFVFYEVMLGAAASLYSGADIALLYDSLEASKGQCVRSQRKSIGNILAARSLAEASAAILCSILMALGGISWVFIGQIIAGWVPLLIAMTIREVPSRTKASTNHIENIKTVMTTLFQGGELRYIVLVMTIWSMSTFYGVWLFQKYWQEASISLSVFGLLWALYNACVGVTSKITHSIEAKIGVKKLLLIMGLLPCIGYFSMSLWLNEWGIMAGLLIQITRGIHQVTMKDALNRRISGQLRATVNSLMSFGFRACFLLTGPVVGWSIDKFGMTETLKYLSFLFFLLFWIMIVPLVKTLTQPNQGSSS